MFKLGVLTKYKTKYRLFFLQTGVSIVALLLVVGITAAEAQSQIVIRVDTVSVSPDSPIVTIPIWLDNPSDTLAGFEVWYQLNRPDMLKFESRLDTLFDTVYWNCLTGTWPACTDSALATDTSSGYDFISVILFEIAVGQYDTSGGLISDWEFVDSRILAGNGFDVKVTAIADIPSSAFTPGFGPQSGGLLLNLVATVLPIPDTLTDRVVIIHAPDSPDNVSFSDPFGVSLSYELNSGSVTILPPKCCLTPGDADNDGAFNIADVTFGIARIFSSGPAPACQDAADINGDNSFNIADVTYGIARIFSSGSEPICGTTGS